MKTLYRLVSITSFWFVCTLSHAVPITLDFSAYPSGTPIASVSIPGVTFEVSPGTTAVVNHNIGTGNGFFMYGNNTQASVTIRTSSAMTSSTFATHGYGSCQTPLPGDIVKWYLGPDLIETNDNFVQYLGRCDDRQFTRNFAHDAITFEPHYDSQYGSQEMYVNDITLDFTPPVATTQAIPTLSEWSQMALIGLMGLTALVVLGRKNS